MFCRKCGGKIESYSSHCPFCGIEVNSNNVQATYTSETSSTVVNGKSVWGWIGIYIVSGIPIIGFILLCIWAFGKDTQNDKTFRNWAKAQLLVYLLTIILITIYFVLILLPIINDFADKQGSMF